MTSATVTITSKWLQICSSFGAEVEIRPSQNKMDRSVASALAQYFRYLQVPDVDGVVVYPLGIASPRMFTNVKPIHYVWYDLEKDRTIRCLAKSPWESFQKQWPTVCTSR